MKYFGIKIVLPLPPLTRALLPLLKRAASLQPNTVMGVEKAAIIQISSIAGSVGEVSEPWAGNHRNKIKQKNNHILTGMYAYRCSKTALNMVSANLAVELNSEGVLVTSFHPG